MFSGHFQLSCVPQEVSEVIVQFSVVRKRIQPGSGNQKLQLDLRVPFPVFGKATLTNIPHLNALCKYLEEDFTTFPTLLKYH
jgi:hypothetical protein